MAPQEREIGTVIGPGSLFRALPVGSVWALVALESLSPCPFPFSCVHMCLSMGAAVQVEAGSEGGNQLPLLSCLTHWGGVSQSDSELTHTSSLLSSMCGGPLLTGITGRRPCPPCVYVGSMNPNSTSWDLTTELSPSPRSSFWRWNEKSSSPGRLGSSSSRQNPLSLPNQSSCTKKKQTSCSFPMVHRVTVSSHTSSNRLTDKAFTIELGSDGGSMVPGELFGDEDGILVIVGVDHIGFQGCVPFCVGDTGRPEVSVVRPFTLEAHHCLPLSTTASFPTTT